MGDSELVVAEVPPPRPAAGEALVKTLACGICGSDLNAPRHGDYLVAKSREAGPFGERGDPEKHAKILVEPWR